MRRTGLFALRTAEDLFAKAERDLERLRKCPDDSDRAFDFFVTARHLPEWVYRGSWKDAKRDINGCAVLCIARSVADAGKHFEVTHTNHAGYEGSTAGPIGHRSDKLGDDVHSDTRLRVQLSPVDAEAINDGEQLIGALDLAERVFAALKELYPKLASGGGRSDDL